MALIGSVNEYNSEKEDFPSYVERLEQCFKINKVQEDDKVALFITLVGPATYTVLKKLLMPELPKSKSLEVLLTVLTNHFMPKRLVIVERFHFNKRNQLPNESVSTYIVELKNLAQTCEFGLFLDDALRDRLVCGLSSETIRCRLLLKEGLNFQKACVLAQSMETADSKSRLFQSASNTLINRVDGAEGGAYTEGSQLSVGQVKPVRHFKKERKPSKAPARLSNLKCWRCGRPHDPLGCPVQRWECFVCHKKGHMAKMCRNKKVNLVDDESEESESEELVGVDRISQFSVRRITKSGGRRENIRSFHRINKPLQTVVHVGGNPFKMEVDTGAGVSVMSSKTYRKHFANFKLRDCALKLTTASGSPMEVEGKIYLPVAGNSGIMHKLPIIITKAKSEFLPLLGRSWLDTLAPNWRVNWTFDGLSPTNDNKSVRMCWVDKSAEATVAALKQKYPRVFNEDRSENIEGFVANLVLKDGATPIFHRAYTVPYSLLEVVEKELKDLVDSKTILPVKHSEWASPLVIVAKKDGGIRLCVDFKVTLNLSLKVDHYPLPRLEDVFASLAGCKVFSVLDLSKAYQQLVVGEESQGLLTINTHLGLFRFTRLPYGVASAPAIFQSIMDQILQGLQMTSCYLDDVLIGGRSQADCEKNVKRVLERLEKFNVRVNVSKCKFFCSAVNYLGHTIDGEGIHPMKSKLEAISEAPEPKNLSQLKSYLGLLNFYNRFLPMLSSQLRPLHKLEEKGVEWMWSEECKHAFQLSKKLLMENQALVHYDPHKPLVVTCDASQYGVGAVLSHMINGEERPILFASSTLSKAEQNYSQLEREALAIIFAVKRFHKYIYGHSFILVTDHQPLKTILGPKTGVPTLAASRLQRWAIILSAYRYDIRYKKGIEIPHADMLSRLPLPEVLDEAAGIHSVNSEMPLTYVEIAENTRKDSLLSKILDLTKNGWPNWVSDPNFKPFFVRRFELSVEAECLTWGNRVVIPTALHGAVLDILHDQHPGMVRMKMLARSYVWWPGMNKDIEEKILSCDVCQMTQPDARKVPLSTWPKTSRMWERLHVDFLENDGQMFLICVDSASKWVEAWVMQGTNAQKTIGRLRSSFAMFGFPSEIVSDNGPPFNSGEFAQFCSSNGIRMTKSPPYHPPSNGLAEKGVQTLKRNLKKQVIENSKGNINVPIQVRLDNFLFAYRNTPSTVTGISPAEFIFKQKPRTRLSMLKPTFAQSDRQQKKEAEVQAYQNNRRGPMRKFQVGESVWVHSVRKDVINWVLGRVREVLSTVTYLIEVEGRLKMMHADHMRKVYAEESGIVENLARTTQEDVSVPTLGTPVPSLPSSPTPNLPEDPPIRELEGISPKEEVECKKQPLVLRKSLRTVKPPDRLNL